MSNRVDLTGLMERYRGVYAVLDAEHCDPWELEIIGRSLTDIARLRELQEIQEPERRVCVAGFAQLRKSASFAGGRR